MHKKSFKIQIKIRKDLDLIWIWFDLRAKIQYTAFYTFSVPASANTLMLKADKSVAK